MNQLAYMQYICANFDKLSILTLLKNDNKINNSKQKKRSQSYSFKFQ